MLELELKEIHKEKTDVKHRLTTITSVKYFLLDFYKSIKIYLVSRKFWLLTDVQLFCNKKMCNFKRKLSFYNPSSDLEF